MKKGSEDTPVKDGAKWSTDAKTLVQQTQNKPLPLMMPSRTLPTLPPSSSHLAEEGRAHR